MKERINRQKEEEKKAQCSKKMSSSGGKDGALTDSDTIQTSRHSPLIFTTYSLSSPVL